MREKILDFLKTMRLQRKIRIIIGHLEAFLLSAENAKNLKNHYVYLITFACNSQNQLEIFSANELKQKARRKFCPVIIGLCCGYEEALEMTRTLVEEAYKETGTPNVRKWLENKIKEEGSR